MDNIPNGGFPPIKYCEYIKKENKEFTKQRYFSSNVNELFSSKNIKPIIINDNNKNSELNIELYEVDEI